MFQDAASHAPIVQFRTFFYHWAITLSQMLAAYSSLLLLIACAVLGANLVAPNNSHELVDSHIGHGLLNCRWAIH